MALRKYESGMARAESVVEKLDDRKLLSTTTIGIGGYPIDEVVDYSQPVTINLANGVTATWSIGGDSSANYTSGGLALHRSEVLSDSYTVELDGLPAHTMSRISWPPSDRGEFSYTITAGGHEESESGRTVDGDYNIVQSANYGRWFATDSTSLTITAAADGMSGSDWVLLDGVDLDVYKPKVSIAGGGSTDELDATPTGFTVSRDTPDGYAGTLYGDEAIPSTDVALEAPTGSASEGTDYETFPRSATILSSSTSTAASVLVPVVPKDDTFAEGDEDIFLSLTAPVANGPYTLDQMPSTARATNNGTQKVVLKDNPSITSVTVAVTDENGAGKSTTGDYSFEVKVTVVGEALDRVQFNQTVKSSTVEYDHDGNQLTQSYLFAHNGGRDALTETNGLYAQDYGYDFDTAAGQLTITDPKKGIGTFVDVQADGALGGEAYPISGGITHLHYKDTISRDFEIEFRDSTTHATLDKKHWGYTWSNDDGLWSSFAGSPYSVITAGFLGTGHFSGILNLTGLPSLDYDNT